MVDIPTVVGQDSQQTGISDFIKIAQLVNNIVGRNATTTLVKVLAVTNNGGVSPVGFVDVQPLVNQLDPTGAPTPHGTLHSLPYFRLQGGADAIILDPKVGDIGVAMFASHDISTVKNTKAQANPASRRRFDMSDGLYIGGVLNAVPVQYIVFAAAGITVVSPMKVTVQAPICEYDASTSFTVNSPLIHFNGFFTQGGGSYGGTSTLNGNVTVIGDVATTGALANNGHAVGSTHQHLNSGGSGTGGVPV